MKKGLLVIAGLLLIATLAFATAGGGKVQHRNDGSLGQGDVVQVRVNYQP